MLNSESMTKTVSACVFTYNDICASS